MKKPYNLMYIIALSMITAMGGLLFGYDLVVIGGAKPFYEQYFQIASNPGMQGWAISCAIVGCILGSVISGVLSDIFGRKKLLMLAAVLFLVSALGTGFSNLLSIFIVYRIIGGVGIGLASNLAPVYIAEIAPADIRGRFVSINQLTIVIGILLAQIVNWVIAKPIPDGISETELLNSWNGQQAWRNMFWAEGVPASMFLLLLFFVPDSPRWLIAKKEEKKAFHILNKIGGIEYAENTSKEIQHSLDSGKKHISISFLFSSKFFPLLLIGIILAIFQQWSGINVIFLYAEEVFVAAGYNLSDMLFNVVITGSVNFAFTILAILMVDKIGRKKLMLVGSISLSIVYLILGSLYYFGFKGAPLLIFVVAAIACFATTLGPVTWVLLAEIFPNRIRGAAMAVSTFSLWTANALLAKYFPVINANIDTSGSFWLFSGICFAGFLFILFKIKETKGKTLEKIEEEFGM